MQKKNILIVAAVLIAVIAWFVISNTLLKGHEATIILHDGDWTTVSWSVREGDADRFTAELTPPRRLKVRYTGEGDLTAAFTLGDSAGNFQDYTLRIYREPDLTADTYTVRTDFIRAE